MSKQAFEIELSSKFDSFERLQFLKKYKGIQKVYVVTSSKLRIYYDPEKITIERIISLSRQKPERKKEKAV